MKKKLITFAIILLIILEGIYIIPRISSSGILNNKSKVKIELDYTKIYLVPTESKKINSSIADVSWESSNEEVATVDNGIITGISPGTTVINATSGKSKTSLEVVVTDLISLPVINNKKEYLKCDFYSEEDSNLLDEILAYRIKEAGENTRAGAVAAARFLSLEFKYRINYFLENGRLVTTGNRTLCDGEGRYYHKGLYLHKNKMQDITVSSRGPAIWGCSLYNGVTGKVMDNGLDCSGFVTWALLNAGYNPPDGGAGINPSITTDNDDLGTKVAIKTAINTNAFKVGDLLSRYGHIGIIIGVDEQHVYIAEALDNDLHVLTTKKNQLNKDWTYLIDMKEYYGSDGNLTDMW